MRISSVGTEGPRVVLVHGNDLCGEFYAPLAHALAARNVSTTLPTLPGFHREPPLPDPSWSALVDAVLAIVDEAAGDAPVFLAGHSMGGLVALLAAARRPRIEGLVLLEPAIFPTKLLARVAARRYLARVVNAQRAEFENHNGGMRRVHDVARYPRAAIDLYLEVRASSDVATGRALFATLPSQYPLPWADVAGLPTLLVTGAHTGVVGRMMAASIARRLAVTHVVAPRAAHWLAHEDDDAIAEAIAGFVSARPSSARAAPASAPAPRARA